MSTRIELMIFVVLLYLISAVISQTTLNCASAQACTYDCQATDCENAIFRAELATSLSITNCGVVSKYCDGLSIYCPLYNAVGNSQDTCSISGTAANSIKGVEIFAQNAWYDVLIDDALIFVTTSGGSTMHCGADTLSYSCKFGAGGADNNQCATNAADKTCNSFIMTGFPTKNPSNNPSMQPTLSPTQNPIPALVLTCPTANQACSFDCNVEQCQFATIRAEIASTLTVANCGKQANNCDDLDVYCPQYNGQTHAAGTCIINGGPNNPVTNLDIYAQDGFYDVDVVNNINLVVDNATQMHCGSDPNTNTYTCNFGAGGASNDVCETSAPDKTCETFQMTTTSNPTTSNPTTSNPTTSNPTTSNPTTSNPTTSNPSFSPTTSDPTASNPTTSNPTTIPTTNPTFYPTVQPTTIMPTTATSNPTITPTINPTSQPSTNPTKTPSTSPSVQPSFVPSTNPTRTPTLEHEVGTTSNTSDEQGIQGDTNGEQNGYVVPLVIVLSIVAVLCFLGVAYWIVVKKRKLEEQYGAEFRKAASEMIEMEMVYHTIPDDNLSRSPTSAALPEKQRRPPRTTTMSGGEHMEYNEVFGSPRAAVVPLSEDENENENKNENRRLFYQAQFMQMMMEDPQQQAYLLGLDPVQRRQHIQYQTGLYLARVEEMARKKTLPIYDGGVDTGDIGNMGDIGADEDVGTNDESVSVSAEGDIIQTGIVTANGEDFDVDMDESIDNIGIDVEESDEDSDQSIIQTIENTKGMIDMEDDSCFD